MDKVIVCINCGYVDDHIGVTNVFVIMCAIVFTLWFPLMVIVDNTMEMYQPKCVRHAHFLDDKSISTHWECSR